MRAKQCGRFVVVSLVAVVSAGGCNRQDADALGRIGRMVARRAEALKPAALPGLTPTRGKDQGPKYEPRPNPAPEKKTEGGEPTSSPPPNG
jgi:hypothetical protein